MNNFSPTENAVAAIRISSVKQGLQGDSPEAQKEQIERFAATHGIHIKKFFIFMESASKEEQPVQEAIDYCKNPKNDVQLFIIKSIDRFTRGGSYLYDHLKMQLTRYGVRLVDIYGIISSQEVNTLEHLDVQYSWSVYSPTKKAEILEAERAKDEMRDIMSRMIGAEIRYTRLGYRVRIAPFGYVNEKIETPHGKRVVLKPHPEESHWIIRMFELRLRGTLSDRQIVTEINKLGYKSRKIFKRNPKDRTQVIGSTGEKKLTLKQMWKYVQSPIYAGVNIEKWTKDQPVKCQFDGLVTIDMFNKANKGKILIAEENGQIKIYKNKPADWLINKGVRNVEFPYKRYVLCPECKQPFYASSSRGKLGKRYPAYHCHSRGHYIRIPQKDFDATIQSFVKNIHISQEYIDQLKEWAIAEWKRRIDETKKDSETIDQRINDLNGKLKATGKKINLVSTQTAMKIVEDELVKIEKEIKSLENQKTTADEEIVNMEIVMDNVSYFLEHLEELLLGGSDLLKRAAYFGLLFDEAPTYNDLVFGTPKLAPYIKLNDDFKGQLVPVGEPREIRTRNQYLKRVLLYR